MIIFNYITWAPDPALFSLGPVAVRYYGLFFTIAFILGYYIAEKMYKRDNAPQEWLDKLFIFVMVATIIGARMGHVIFYGWDYYSTHPEDIIKVWEGGLASHGGAVGILVAVFMYSRFVTKRSMLWTLDKLVVPVALGATFIRLGNLMNSEIVGSVTTVPWGFVFLKAHGLDDPTLPRHPAQLYEALCYLGIFILLMYMYWRRNASERPGLMFGTLLTSVFGCRFLIEFVKENQEAFEDSMLLNMGQLLSIPFIILGIYFVNKALKSPKVETLIIENRRERRNKK